jgi:hypothetical protein
MGYQMLALTIGWQIYELTNSAFDLGLVGLIQFVPAVVLTLLIGHAADRYDRRSIVRAAHCVYALAAVMITTALLTETLGRNLLFIAVFIIGCADSGPTILDLACDCRLDFGEPDGCDLRARARWTHLCDQPSADRLRLPDLLRLLDHVGYFGHRARPGAAARTADIRVRARRFPLHPQPAPSSRRHHA